MQTQKRILHIDGIRALAILGVVLFHLFPDTIPCGYFGVDVFLMISGYLLFRSPIFKPEGTPLHAIGNFCSKKIKRLILPLAVSVLIAFIAGFITMVPADFITMCKTGLAALFGVSNVYLDWAQSDYFGLDTLYNSLVPTWYMSMICQVYLIFLIGSLIAKRIPRKVVIWILSILFIPLFLYGRLDVFHPIFPDLQEILPMPSHYSTWGHMWAVLFGGGALLLPEAKGKALRNVLSGIGLGLLLLTFVPFETSRSLWQVAVVAGGVLTLRYATQCPIERMWTFVPVQWLGKVSFSLYLLHMPVYITVLLVADNMGVAAYTILVAALLAGVWGFHKYVETCKWSYTWVGIMLWLAAVAATGAGSCYNGPGIYMQQGVKALKTQALKDMEPALFHDVDGRDIEQYARPKSRLYRRIGGDGDISYMVIGDSHSVPFAAGMSGFSEKHNMPGLFLNMYLMPMHNWELKDPRYSWFVEKQEAFYKWIAAQPEIKSVIICQRWCLRLGMKHLDRFHMKPTPGTSGDPEVAVSTFITKLHDMGKNVIVVEHAPSIKSQTPQREYQFYLDKRRKKDYRKLICTEETYEELYGGSNRFLYSLEEKGLCHVLKIKDILLKDGLFFAAEDGYMLMSDDNHLSNEGAKKVIDANEDELLRLLTLPASPQPAKAGE